MDTLEVSFIFITHTGTDMFIELLSNLGRPLPSFSHVQQQESRTSQEFLIFNTICTEESGALIVALAALPSMFLTKKNLF